MQNAQKSRNINDFLFLYISSEEIENFAKQILVYNNPRIILFALSTTDVFAYFVGFAHKAILFGLGLNNRFGWSSAFRMQRYDIFYGRWRKMAQDWRQHPVGN